MSAKNETRQSINFRKIGLNSNNRTPAEKEVIGTSVKDKQYNNLITTVSKERHEISKLLNRIKDESYTNELMLKDYTDELTDQQDRLNITKKVTKKILLNKQREMQEESQRL